MADNRGIQDKGKVVKMRPRETAVKPAKKKESGASAKLSKKPIEKKASSNIKYEAGEMKKQTPKTQNIMETAMTKSTMAFDKFSKEAADMSREYSDACMKSGTIFMKGFENIMGTLMSLAQSSAEKQARFMKEAMSSKTINEFAEVQNKICQASFDDFMSNATKISEMGVKILTESSEPVNNQMTKAIQRATETIAA